jgi:hypothetical protein
MKALELEDSPEHRPTVFVLGAGYTRGFAPRAPLLVDDHGVGEITKRFAAFPVAKGILEEALRSGRDGKVDLERLMTRLGGMPYDADEARRELALLEAELKSSLVRRLNDAKMGDVDWTRLATFARYILDTGASIVTFNYDDVVDEALWKVWRVTDVGAAPSYWHPDGGYGFFCRPSTSCVADSTTIKDRAPSLLLKLHGSINWRVRRGEVAPLGPTAIVHHEGWLPPPRGVDYDTERIEAHLERDPLIIPPVLAKSELSLHPALRVVWELAFQTLGNAKSVVFIGYSIPQTDLAARTLFAEAWAREEGPTPHVVNLAAQPEAREEIKAAYRALLPHLQLSEECFTFDGVQAWVDAAIPPRDATEARHR